MEGFEVLSRGAMAYFESGVDFMNTIRLLPPGSPTTSAKTIAGGGPAATFVTPSLVTFPAPDGTVLHAQLFEPAAEVGGPSAAAGKRPAALFTHGGCQRQMYAAMHYAYDYASLYAQNQYLASQGFVVLSVNYRGGGPIYFHFQFDLTRFNSILFVTFVASGIRREVSRCGQQRVGR